MCRKNRSSLPAGRLTAALLLAVTLSSTAIFAGPIPAAPLAPLPVAGESDLPSFIFPLTSDITVDWIVVDYAGGLIDPESEEPIPAGGFLYLYQIENTSAVAMDALSITMGPGGAASVFAAGVLPGDDLDLPGALHPAHSDPMFASDGPVAGPFPILAGEEGPFGMAPLSGVLTTVNLADNNVTWTFNPLSSGKESDTLFYLSSLPPIYGNGVAQDSTPPSPWGSLAMGGDPVPVPGVPEPGSLALAALGAAAVGLFGRRRPR